MGSQIDYNCAARCSQGIVKQVNGRLWHENRTGEDSIGLNYASLLWKRGLGGGARIGGLILASGSWARAGLGMGYREEPIVEYKPLNTVTVTFLQNVTPGTGHGHHRVDGGAERAALSEGSASRISSDDLQSGCYTGSGMARSGKAVPELLLWAFQGCPAG